MNKETQDILNKVTTSFRDEYFWFQDVSKDKDEIFYSESVVDVTGYTPDELVKLPGKGKENILDVDLRELKNRINEFKKEINKSSVSFDFRIKRKDNEVIWVRETIIVERDDQGRITKYLGRISNISEYKSIEESLKSENTELQKINSAKDSFIGMISHDLRAPFTSILGFSEILLNETDLTDSEKEEYLSYINDSSQNQLQLVNDLLDWSRLQTGKLKIEPVRVRAQGLAFSAVSSLTGNAIRKGIDIKVDIPEKLFIYVDERLVHQVITNLLANAIKFSNEKSTVEISANIFNHDLTEFVVKDEGIGIPEEGKDKLFKIGRMFSTDGTKGEKGTGLGLTLTKQIVEKHDGEIWFYSTPGKGSEFHFTVPSSANSIIVIHNNNFHLEANVNIVRNVFPSYQVLKSVNGYDALGIIIRQMPSLIITVHEMPLMNGFQLIKTLHKEDNPLLTPVIAMLNSEKTSVAELYDTLGIKTIKDSPDDLKLALEEYRSILR